MAPKKASGKIFHKYCIVLGDLKGIRKQNNRGKRLNRIINSMPYYSLDDNEEIIKVIPVLTINEAYTSSKCHICSSEGERKTQGYSFVLTEENTMLT
jgi:IS605 OrfB family transposase